MRLLVDNARSPKLASALRSAGHDAVHVREISMGDAEDEVIFARAANDNRIIISADTDFVRMLALQSATKPSVVLFREGVPHEPKQQAEFFLANLSAIEDQLLLGAIVVFDGTRIRVRTLPIN